MLLGGVNLGNNYTQEYAAAGADDVLLFSVSAHIFTEQSEARI